MTRAATPLSTRPWGVHVIADIYSPNVGAGLPDGRWVLAAAEPYAPTLRSRFAAAWWVFTGRAHALVWPRPGDLEARMTPPQPWRPGQQKGAR